jgi:hypothetical protein
MATDDLLRQPEVEAGKTARAPERTPTASQETDEPAIAFVGDEPGDLDQATVLRLQRTVGNAAVARLVQRRAAAGADSRVSQAGRPARRALQRYQAGPTGHGGIEERALGAAGFSEREVGQVYIGNWMRDLSQLPPAAFPLVNLLALGEFGREITPQELGTYLPSEHMDNPQGGGTVQDPAVQADPARLAEELARLSADQRAAYDSEEARRGEILDASVRSELPAYVERSKLHAKDKLKQGARLGRGPAGMQAMGDALHAVEDYYSHSNFTEACILQMRADPAIQPLHARLTQTHLGRNLALLVPEQGGRMQIQTGTYAPGPNAWVSKLELLQTEFENGMMTRAFILGWVRKAGIEGAQLGEMIGGAVGAPVGAVLGGIGGAVSGGFTGAIEGAVEGGASGAASGGRSGSAVGGAIGGLFGEGAGEVGSAIGGGVGSFFGGLVGGVRGLFGGAVSGAVEGAQEGAQSGGVFGRELGGAAGSFAGRTAGEIVGALSLATLMTALLPIVAPFILGLFAAAKAGVLEWAVQRQTLESGGQARQLGLSGPTHSELAKDAPEHPLWAVSAGLAEAADQEIGEAMIRIWAGEPIAAAQAPTQAPVAVGVGGPSAPEPPSSGPAPSGSQDPFAASDAELDRLVDKYVCHPTHETWWQDVLRRHAR